jgi:predicted RNA methylase
MLIEQSGYAFSGEAKDLNQYFTGRKLAKRIVQWAELSRGMRVLEPSAGDGGIVQALPMNIAVTAVETDPRMAAELRRINHPALTVIEGDFLKVTPGRDSFDVAIMNPPYGEGADGRHTAQALRYAQRVIVLVRVNFEYGVERFNTVFRWSQVTRRALLTRRPHFYGPANEGHTARHDYVVLELVRRDDRLKDPTPDQVETEYWTESWSE